MITIGKRIKDYFTVPIVENEYYRYTYEVLFYYGARETITENKYTLYSFGEYIKTYLLENKSIGVGKKYYPTHSIKSITIKEVDTIMVKRYDCISDFPKTWLTRSDIEERNNSFNRR